MWCFLFKPTLLESHWLQWTASPFQNGHSFIVEPQWLALAFAWHHCGILHIAIYCSSMQSSITLLSTQIWCETRTRLYANIKTHNAKRNNLRKAHLFCTKNKRNNLPQLKETCTKRSMQDATVELLMKMLKTKLSSASSKWS